MHDVGGFRPKPVEDALHTTISDGEAMPVVGYGRLMHTDRDRRDRGDRRDGTGYGHATATEVIATPAAATARRRCQITRRRVAGA